MTSRDLQAACLISVSNKSLHLTGKEVSKNLTPVSKKNFEASLTILGTYKP